MACVKIEKAQNGYEVEVTDPKIVAANRKDDMKGPWRDPCVSYVFKTVDEVLEFLKKNLDKALPADEFTTSFDAAVGEEEDD